MYFDGAVEEKELYSLFMENVDNYIADLHDGIVQMQEGKGMATLLRHLHTLKGNAGAIGLKLIVWFAHEIEQQLMPYQNKEGIFSNNLFSILETAENIITICLYTKDHAEYQSTAQAIIHDLRAVCSATQDYHQEVDSNNNEHSIIDQDLGFINSVDEATNPDVTSVQPTHQVTITFIKDTEYNPVFSAICIQNILKEHVKIIHSNPDIRNIDATESFSEFQVAIVYAGDTKKIRDMLQHQHAVESVNIITLHNKHIQKLNLQKIPQYKDLNITINLSNFKKLESTVTDVFEQQQKFSNALHELSNTLQSYHDVPQHIQRDIDISTSMLTQTSRYGAQVSNDSHNINMIVQKLATQLQSILSEHNDRVFTAFNIVNEQSYNIRNTIYNLWRLSTQTQMLPMQELFKLLPPIVDQISAKVKKDVSITFEGSSIMVDTSLLSHIHDPIVHCLRNSIDHGIELPHIRKEREKNVQGSLIIRAKNMGKYLKIDCIDDGGGIDTNKVRNAAIKRRDITESDVLTDKEILQLLFKIGLTTVDNITMLSGHGIGMNVVKTAVEHIGGTINMYTELGQGTKISLMIPLKMSIIPCIIVKIHQERLAIPFLYILEIVATEEIPIQNNTWQYKGKSLPLLNLQHIYYEEVQTNMCTKGYIIIYKTTEQYFAVHVQDIIAYQEVVVKVQRTYLPEFIIGTSMMLDGDILLVVDLSVLFQYIQTNMQQSHKDMREVEYAR